MNKLENYIDHTHYYHHRPQSACIVTFWAKEEGNCAVCKVVLYMLWLICVFVEICLVKTEANWRFLNTHHIRTPGGQWRL